MKIGKLVKQHIEKIFLNCDNFEHDEIYSLLDLEYSKNMFGINFPFCIELENINENIKKNWSKRYWAETYLVRGKQVRVTSQWFEMSESLFMKYLELKGISPELESNQDQGSKRQQVRPPSSRSNSRYRGNAIGNAQNLFIRNILSNLGVDSFTEENWNSTKDYFSRKCVYCGAETELLMEHAIPINKEKLGEHKLGNLVPSCKPCNNNKGGKDFREFLGENEAAISRIEEYMNSRNYVPLENNEQMKMIMNIAHKEVATISDKYIKIINELFFSEFKFRAR